MSGLYLPRLGVIDTSGGTAQAALDAFIRAEAQAYGATSVYDANDILASDQQQLKNRAYPTAARAKRGSTARAQIVPEGLYLPGENTNYASTPFKASFNGGTSSFELYVQTGSLSVTRSTSQMVASRWIAAGNQRAFYLQLQTTGIPQIVGSADGATVAFVAASSTAITAGATGVGVTRDPTTGSVSFYQELSGSWELLSTVSGATGALFASTAALEVGSYTLGVGGLNFQGLIRSATFTVGGTILASPDFVAAIDGNTTLVDAQSNVWTVTATTGVDTNDPVFLPHTGEHYVWFPGGNTNNSLSTPDSASLDVGAGVTKWVFRLSSTLNPANQGTWASRRVSALTWQIAADTAAGPARVSCSWRIGAVDLFNDAFIDTSALTNNVWYWFEITRSSATGVVTARVHADNAARPDVAAPGWSSLTVTGPQTAGAIDNSSEALQVGVNRTAVQTLQGSLKYFSFEHDDTPIVTIVPSNNIDTAGNPNAGQTSFTATTGQTVTVNRSATGLKTAVVTRPDIVLDGTDDHLQLPASDTPTFTATTGKHTVVVAFRTHESTTAYQRLWSAENTSANNGAYLALDNLGRVVSWVGNGPGFISGGFIAVTVGELSVAAIVCDDGTVKTYLNGSGLLAGSSYAGLAPSPTFNPPRVGTVGFSAGNPLRGEVLSVLTFKDQALTVVELDAIAARLLEGAYA